MATVNFKIGKPRRDGKMRVSFILHSGHRSMTLPGGVFLERGDVSRKGRITSRAKDLEVSNIVNGYNERALKADLEFMGREDIDALYSYLTRPDGSGLEFFSFADEFIRNYKGYTYNFRCALNSLERYLGRRYLLFADIDYRLLSGFCSSLDGHPSAQSGYLGTIRRIYNEAVRTYNTQRGELIPPSPFAVFRVPRQKALRKRRAVDVSTLKKILSYHGEGRAETARDCYLMSFCLMGMNTCDMYDRDAVMKDGCVCYHRKKVRTRRDDEGYIEVRVPEIIMPLMRKYKDASRLFGFHRRYSNDQNFNKYVNIGRRRIAGDIGVPEFDFYSARHTWATIARNRVGIDKYTVNEALNHVDTELKIADVYIDRDFTQINIANRKVVEYVFGPLAYSGSPG